MAKATKGVKVRALAEELGLDHRVIMKKLKDEGLDWAHNHMSNLSFGQAETIREWFRSGELGSAADHAAAVAEADEPAKAHRPRKKKEGEQDHADHGEGVAVAEAHEHIEHPEAAEPAELVPAEPASPAVTAEPVVTAPVVAEVPVSPEPVEPASAPATTPVPAVEAPSAAPVAPVEPPRVAASAPTATPPAPAAPAARPVVPKKEFPQPPKKVERPTIKLGDKKAMPTPAFVPRPATIQGPRVVREEKPDIVPTPHKRVPREQQGSSIPSFATARTQGGRGVKRSDDEEESDANKKAGNRTSLSTRRRGADGRRGEADEKLREFTDADLIEREERLRQAAKSRQELDTHLKKTAARGQHQLAKTGQQRGEVELELPITVRTLSSGLGIKANELIMKLMRQGVMANINQSLDITTAQAIALDYGVDLSIKREESLEEQLQREFDERQVDPANLTIRPPVVTILGHVDHGKTSLLDKIRSANVAAGEAGGITQHIAAWMVTLGTPENPKRVTFIDTPGHQAFTAMRARGANMTDVVVLVVSAAEGVQPQTIESINHARAANVPIVVAMNKIDRPDANPDMVLGQLAAQGLNPTQWGGETEVVPTSAINGQGVPELIEILDLQSQIMELKSDPTAPASGRVIESAMLTGIGPSATVLVQSGTLKVGDILLVGGAFGRVRSLINDRGQMIDSAGPSTPVIVAGLNGLASSGDKFYVMDDMERARTIAEDRANRQRQTHLGQQSRVTGSQLLSQLATAGEVKTIHLIIKGDVQGSVETLVNTVTAQNTEEVQVKVIHYGVGTINESDVELAMATRINPDDPTRPRKVAIIGFHVVPEESARAAAEQNHIDVKMYRVIYEIFDDLKKALSGMLEPEVREKLHGHADIRRVFKYSKVGNIAGCMVSDGHISRGSKIRLIRDGRVITEDLAIETLKRVKDDVKEVKSGFECGIKLAGYDDIKEGDRLEAYVREKHERTL